MQLMSRDAVASAQAGRKSGAARVRNNPAEEAALLQQAQSALEQIQAQRLSRRMTVARRWAAPADEAAQC